MDQKVERFLAICPYCGKALEKVPQRKKKCKFCGNFIFVKRLPSTRETVLVTESEAKKIDLEWEKRNERIEYLNILAGYGLKENDFERRKSELSEKRKGEASDRDVVLSLLNELTLKYIKNNDYQGLSHLYYTMALILDKAGKDFKECLAQSNKMNLLDFRTAGIKKVRIRTAGEQSCSACKALSGKVISVDEALKSMPLPCEHCTSSVHSDNPGFCRCQYVYEMDLGQIIKEREEQLKGLE